MIIRYKMKNGSDAVLNYALCENLYITSMSMKTDKSNLSKLVANMISGKSYIIWRSAEEYEVKSTLDRILESFKKGSDECMI